MNKEWADHQEQINRKNMMTMEEWERFFNKELWSKKEKKLYYKRLNKGPITLIFWYKAARFKPVLIVALQLIAGILIGWLAVYFYFN